MVERLFLVAAAIDRPDIHIVVETAVFIVMFERVHRAVFDMNLRDLGTVFEFGLAEDDGDPHRPPRHGHVFHGEIGDFERRLAEERVHIDARDVEIFDGVPLSVELLDVDRVGHFAKIKVDIRRQHRRFCI